MQTALTIDKGSGYFHIEEESAQGVVSCHHDNRSVVSCRHDDQSRSIQVSPVNEGQVTLRVRDLCLIPQVAPRAEISVAGVERIELNVLDKVRNCIKLRVTRTLRDRKKFE